MEIITDKSFKLKNTCVTIGKFDGLHIGHQSIFKVMDGFRDSLKLTVFTFKLNQEQMPERKHSYEDGQEKVIFNSGNRIYSEEKKEHFLDHHKVDYLIEYPFDDETRNTEAEDFVRNTLIDCLDMKVLVVGDNFRFGKDRKGDCELLEQMSKEYGFRLIVIPCVRYEDQNVSSTMIRNMISQGNFEKANKLLGDKFWND